MKLALILSLGTIMLGWVLAIYSRSSGTPTPRRRNCYVCAAELDGELDPDTICAKCRKGATK